MRYFELKADRGLSNLVQIQKIDTQIYKNGIPKESFDAIRRLQVAYFDHSEQTEVCDVLEEPAFMVSDALRRVFLIYEPRMEFRGVQLFANDMEDRTAPLYWMPYIEAVSCMGMESRKYPNGMLEKLVLDRDAPIHDRHVFRVADILEYRIVISLPVAESMIRRQMTGITFEPVAFSGSGKEGALCRTGNI
ncbi:MAG: hypothetical protein J6C19_06635 [Lachnospiraceae bacterium]|nr:hypothetical protein [Lachnospiraceae bacterium]